MAWHHVLSRHSWLNCAFLSHLLVVIVELSLAHTKAGTLNKGVLTGAYGKRI